MRHAVQIHVVAQQRIKIRHGKQHFPFGQAGAVGRCAAHAVHAFGEFGGLVEVVHPRAVFLAERDLPFVLQLGEDFRFGALEFGGMKGSLHFLPRFGQQGLRFWRIQLFQGGIRVVCRHSVLSVCHKSGCCRSGCKWLMPMPMRRYSGSPGIFCSRVQAALSRDSASGSGEE